MNCPTQTQLTWSTNLVLIILYLGAGASVLAFLCWNMAIARLALRALLCSATLIPVFSILEAVLILDEQITMVHGRGRLVIVG